MLICRIKKNEKTQKNSSSLLAVTLGFFASSSPVFAAVGDQGVDWAVYQKNEGHFGYAHDKFSISQIGGYNGSGIYWHSIHASQVQSSIVQGKRAHTYI